MKIFGILRKNFKMELINILETAAFSEKMIEQRIFFFRKFCETYFRWNGSRRNGDYLYNNNWTHKFIIMLVTSIFDLKFLLFLYYYQLRHNQGILLVATKSTNSFKT